MNEKHTLVDNIVEQRYEFDIDGAKAFVEYSKQPGLAILTHAYVPEHLEGQGIGSALVRAVLEDLKIKKLQIVPQCSFVAQYICRHPEWEALIYKQEAHTK